MLTFQHAENKRINKVSACRTAAMNKTHSSWLSLQHADTFLHSPALDTLGFIRGCCTTCWHLINSFVLSMLKGQPSCRSTCCILFNLAPKGHCAPSSVYFTCQAYEFWPTWHVKFKRKGHITDCKDTVILHKVVPWDLTLSDPSRRGVACVLLSRAEVWSDTWDSRNRKINMSGQWCYQTEID